MLTVKPAQKVRIGVEASNGQILQFFAYIKKIEVDRLTLVFSEEKAHLSKYLKEGNLIRSSIYTPTGILLQESIILNEPVNCEFEIEFSKSRKRIQRRRYFRVNANYRMIIEQMNKTYTVLTKDISGGGVRFICDEYLHKSEVKAKLYIPEHRDAVVFTGDILQKPYFKENEYIIRFVNIQDYERNRIIQKCMEIEAKNMREG